MSRTWIRIAFVITFMLLMVFTLSAVEKKENPKVVIVTSMGEIELELYPDKAPISVENFLSYVSTDPSEMKDLISIIDSVESKLIEIEKIAWSSDFSKE